LTAWSAGRENVVTETLAGKVGGTGMTRSKKRDDFEAVVPDGTPLNEAVSAMIKELRRGKELTALYWAKQIEARYWKYVWKRLMIFAAEDVSVANPDAVVQVHACYEGYVMTRENKKGGDLRFCPHCGAVEEEETANSQRADKDLLALAVLVLARSDKCRESNLLWAMLIELEKVGWRPEVPEYALDGHTRRGRALHPDPHERHVKWFLEWSRVEPNRGPNDVHAWHVARMVAQGRFPADVGQEILDGYRERGELRYEAGGEPWPTWQQVARDPEG
jgi:hypothetical protein